MVGMVFALGLMVMVLRLQGVKIVQEELEEGVACQGGWAVLSFKSVPDAAEAVQMCALLPAP